MLKVELVSLAYSLTAHKSRYKLSFEDKLISLGIKPTASKNSPVQQASHFCIGPEINYSANSLPLTFLFVLGFCRATVSNYSFKSTPYLGRYVFKRVDRFMVSIFKTPSLVEIGKFLNKIEANLNSISKKLAQLKLSSSQGISPETVLKMSANNPKSMGVLVHDLKTDTKKNYTSFRQAGLSLGFSPVTIMKYYLASSPYLGEIYFWKSNSKSFT